MNGPVKLTAETEYGKQNDWDKIFNLYYDTTRTHTFIGGNLNRYVYTANGPEDEKKIVVSTDGSVYMSHKNRYEIWKFGPDGSFQKKIGSKGSKPGQFGRMPSVQCFVGNKYFLTSDADGKLNLFDLGGNYKKTISLRYMPLAFKDIDEKYLLIISFFIGKVNRKDLVIKLNIETSEEKILWERAEKREATLQVDNIDSLINSKKGNMRLRIPGFGPVREDIIFLTDGKTLVTSRKSAEYKIYDQTGKVSSGGKMEIDPVSIKQEDVQQNYEIMKSSFTKSISDYRQIIERNKKENPKWSSAGAERVIDANQKWLNNVEIFRDLKNYYPYFPYYSNIIQDDEGNLLCFEFTSVSDKATNRFNLIALDKNGKKLARTSFTCDDYELSFSSSSFVISKGFVYAVAKLKNTKGMPLRLVKFRMEPLK
jgi:hypothetical protein